MKSRYPDLIMKSRNPELITLSKEAAETTTPPTHPKSPVNDLPVDIPERFTNHLPQQVLLLQTELKNKDNYIKSVLLQLSKQSDMIYCFLNLSKHKHLGK